ncbi:MAG: hypothetical protein KG003_10000 [Bacteroidetes bacterium]|nr:hypothetical protein [Bacteroidota bacterium]
MSATVVVPNQQDIDLDFELENLSEPFVMIPNLVAQNLDMSLEALGALTRMLSYSKNFKFKLSWLQKAWGIGRDKLKNIIKELKNLGFIKFVSKRTPDNTKFSGWKWFLSNKPVFKSKGIEKEIQKDGFSVSLEEDKNQSDEISDSLNISNSLRKTRLKDKKKNNKKKTFISPDFELTHVLIEWTQKTFEKKIPLKELIFQTDLFIQEYLDSGIERTSWTRSWMTWIKNAVSWDKINYENLDESEKVLTPPKDVNQYIVKRPKDWWKTKPKAEEELPL